MHSALLIDEILRQIFYFCSEFDRCSLVAAARSCMAWKDPALDLVWDRLLSPGPLLSLLPGVSVLNDQYVLVGQPSQNDLTIFNSYARRVKHVSHRHEIKIHPSIAAVMLPFIYPNDTALPNLTTAHISMPRCNALLMPLYISPKLRHLDIDLGFKSGLSSADTMLCDYLEQAKAHCLGLEHISLRGLASERLNCIISSMHNLRVVSLRLGRSLMPQTLIALMGFLHLVELEVHAGHIDHNELDDIPPYQDHATFGSLRNLHIRAKSAFIGSILHYIEPNTLHHLHIEIDDHSPSTSWNTIFASVCDKTSNTLSHLALEHHFELPETDSSISPDVTQNTQSSPTHNFPSMLFETIAILRSLKHLRHFACDVTVPPALRDQDIKNMVSWWPDLEHLELGYVLQADEDEAQPTSHLTIASLAFFAAKCPNLKKLILPLAIDDLSRPFPAATATTTSQLQSLTVTQLETSNPSELAHYLHHLFPSMQHLEGRCDDSQAWTDTSNAFHWILRNKIL